MNTDLRCDTESVALPGYLMVLPWQLTAIGGVNRVVRELSDGLARIGAARPQILVSLWDPRSLEPCSGFEVSGMRLRGPGTWKEDWRYLVTLPLTLARVRRLILKKNIKFINPHYPSLYCLTFVLAGHLFGVRVFLSFHGEDLKGALVTRGLTRWLWKRLLSRATRLVVCAESQAKLIAEFHPSLERRIEVIRNGVDPKSFIEAASHATITAPDGAFLLMVGVFEFRKGYDILFAVWKQLRVRHPELNLVIVGSGGPDATWVREYAAQASGVVLFEDQPMAAISKLMSRAALLVLPSRAEAFPLVLLEAGAHGLPVVASAVDGVPELIRDGIDGLLVRPGDSESLFLAVERLIGNPVLARQFGASLRNRVRAEFTWLRTSEAYHRLIMSSAGPAQEVLRRGPDQTIRDHRGQ